MTSSFIYIFWISLFILLFWLLLRPTWILASFEWFANKVGFVDRIKRLFGSKSYFGLFGGGEEDDYLIGEESAVEEIWGIEKKLAKVVAGEAGKTRRTEVKRGRGFFKVLEGCWFNTW